MEIILKKHYPTLGHKGEIVKVKPGYAGNYLIPQGIAVVANLANKKCAKQDMLQAAHKATLIKEKAEEQAKKLEAKEIEIKIKAANEDGKIFGSVTSLQIVEAIAECCDIQINPKSIKIKEPIKNLGKYDIYVRLHKTVDCTIKLNIVKED